MVRYKHHLLLGVLLLICLQIFMVVLVPEEHKMLLYIGVVEDQVLILHQIVVWSGMVHHGVLLIILINHSEDTQELVILNQLYPLVVIVIQMLLKVQNILMELIGLKRLLYHTEEWMELLLVKMLIFFLLVVVIILVFQVLIRTSILYLVILGHKNLMLQRM